MASRRRRLLALLSSPWEGWAGQVELVAGPWSPRSLLGRFQLLGQFERWSSRTAALTLSWWEGERAAVLSRAIASLRTLTSSEHRAELTRRRGVPLAFTRKA